LTGSSLNVAFGHNRRERESISRCFSGWWWAKAILIEPGIMKFLPREFFLLRAIAPSVSEFIPRRAHQDHMKETGAKEEHAGK